MMQYVQFIIIQWDLDNGDDCDDDDDDNNNNNGTCMLIDVAISGDRNVIKKNREDSKI